MWHNEINDCLNVLKSGGVILYPTDTVWGIGCDATNASAVEKIFKIKNRPESKSLITLVNDDRMLMRYVRDVPEVAWELIETSEKPITIIYEGILGLAPNILAEDKSAAIRICRDEFCRTLIQKFGKPIISTSANISGEATPQNFKEIDPAIFSLIDYIVKWKQDELNQHPPSSIIKIKNNGEFKIVRK